MRNDKSHFADLHTFSDAEKNLVGAIGTVDENATTSSSRKINLEWMDDQGVNHSCITHDSCCVPSSPVSLLGVTTLGNR